MEKTNPIKYFQLRKEFEVETGLTIRDNKDVYIRWLETHVITLRSDKECTELEILAMGERHG